MFQNNGGVISVSDFVDQLTETAIHYGQAKYFFFYLSSCYTCITLYQFSDGTSIRASFQATDISSFLLWCCWICSRIFLDISLHSARLFKCIRQGVKPGVNSAGSHARKFCYVTSELKIIFQLMRKAQMEGANSKHDRHAELKWEAFCLRLIRVYSTHSQYEIFHTECGSPACEAIEWKSSGSN